mmetsp:Transcript_28731/g.83309  ORF Transcript_28731/g.83309 Transcript_28731/m.83309 type:complete len:341 (-) Transcript_28731:2949-3971(-)
MPSPWPLTMVAKSASRRYKSTRTMLFPKKPGFNATIAMSGCTRYALSSTDGGIRPQRPTPAPVATSRRRTRREKAKRRRRTRKKCKSSSAPRTSPNVPCPRPSREVWRRPSPRNTRRRPPSSKLVWTRSIRSTESASELSRIWKGSIWFAMRCSSDTKRRAVPSSSPSAQSASSYSRRFTASTFFCLACTFTSTAMIVQPPTADASIFPTSTRSTTLSLVASARLSTIRSSSNTSVSSRSVVSTLLTSGVALRRRAMTTSSTATRRISSPPRMRCSASGITTCSKRPRRRALLCPPSCCMMSTSPTRAWTPSSAKPLTRPASPISKEITSPVSSKTSSRM